MLVMRGHYHRREPILLHGKRFQDLRICFRVPRDSFWDRPDHFREPRDSFSELGDERWVIVNCLRDLGIPLRTVASIVQGLRKLTRQRVSYKNRIFEDRDRTSQLFIIISERRRAICRCRYIKRQASARCDPDLVSISATERNDFSSEL